MALPPSCYFIAFLFLLPDLAIAASGSVRIHHHDDGLKSMHFALYQRGTINETDFVIVKGVPGSGIIDPTASPFGTILVLRDPLTTTQDPSSKMVGFAEFTTITSSFDGLDNLSFGKFTLNVEGRKGSISTLGSANNFKPSSIPVIGGTEDFLFVQGYMATSAVDVTVVGFTFKLEFHLYWPPYTAQALKISE